MDDYDPRSAGEQKVEPPSLSYAEQVVFLYRRTESDS